MKPMPDENQVARWLDEEMQPAEREAFASRLKDHESLKADLESLQKLRDALRTNIPAGREVPHADFFNAEIQTRISREPTHDTGARTRRVQAPGWRDWLRLPWLAATAAAVILGVLIWQTRTPGPANTSLILSSYVPNPGIHAQVIQLPDAGAVVLVLDGLAEIPADHKIVGFEDHQTRTDPQFATTSLYSRGGDVLVELGQDTGHPPHVRNRPPRG